MKKIQKIIAGAVMAAMLMAPAGTVLADETQDTCGGVDDGTEVTSETTQELTFETMYGSQIGSYLGHQYTFDGEPIPTYITDFYFINAFLDPCNYAYYGQAPATSEGYIDLAEEFGGEYATFGDYYVAYAENTIESTMIVCKMAEENGIEAVILGCTELPLLLNTDNCPVPCLDSVDIHINEIIRLAMD